MLAEGVDCFAGHLASPSARASVTAALSRCWDLQPGSAALSIVYVRAPSVEMERGIGGAVFRVGRASVAVAEERRETRTGEVEEGGDGERKVDGLPSNFVATRHSLSLLERMAVAVQQREPVSDLL